MRSKLSIGFIALGMAIAVAACSSYGVNNTVNVGPNFPSMTLYASNSNQNAVGIYTSAQMSGTGPTYQIGGATTDLNGPQYLAFDGAHNLWVTNYNPSTNAAALIEIEALATGDVVPLQAVALSGHLRGIAITPNIGTQAGLMVISDVIPTAKYPSELLLFSPGSTASYAQIAGPKPSLHVPGGLALDGNNKIYVANIQGRSVQQFIVPSPTPTPSGSPSPTPSPTPTPTGSPSGSPSPSPTPSPTPTPINIKPHFQISGSNTGLITPISVAIDSSLNVYVVDQGALGAQCSASNAAAIFVFSKPTSKGALNVKPIRKVHGCKSGLTTPTDIKINMKKSLIYVADSQKILVFPLTANGTPSPDPFFNSPGTVTGIGLVPGALPTASPTPAARRLGPKPTTEKHP
jgi:hypothetical protein